MRAIVTGGCGFIGFNLAKALLNKGWEVHVIDNLSGGDIRNQDKRASYTFDTIVYAFDKVFFGAIENLVDKVQPHVVFHLAAIPRVTYSVENPLATTFDNVLGTVSVLEAIRKKAPKCRLVASSSSAVYGGAEEMPTPERCPLDPKSPYALQKLQLEEWCRMYAHLYEMDIACLRYFNVFGEHSLFGGAYSTVLSAWMYHLFVNPESKPFLEGDGEQSRDFCAVDNVVNANILAAECKDKMTGHIFNIAQGKQHRLLYVKSLLEKISGKTLDLDMRPERIGDVRHSLADISHAKNILGYRPDTNFDEQVKKMADWYKDNYPKT